MKNLESFKQICAGPVWDGNLLSKDGRDALVKAGYVARRDGWNLLTVDGVDVAVTFGLLTTNRAQKPGVIQSVLQMVADSARLEEISSLHSAYWERRWTRGAGLSEATYVRGPVRWHSQTIGLTSDMYYAIQVGESVTTRGVRAVAGMKGKDYGHAYYVRLDFYEKVCED